MDSLDHIIEAEHHLSLSDMYWRGKNYDKEIKSLNKVKKYIELAIIEAEKELINQQNDKKGGG